MRILDQRGVEVFDVSAEAEENWTQSVVDTFVDASQLMSACTPSRVNQEGNPHAMRARNGNYGGGFGDYFGYCRVLEQWLEQGDCEGLELDGRSSAR